MPAPLINGALILGTIAALLGAVALIENPEVREWAEEQRRKLADLLHSFGDSLDPSTRRQAEAFAFGSQSTPSRRRESRGAFNAAAVATGADSEMDQVTRRYSTRQAQSSDDAAERRRLGREYLARRNQEMLERQSRLSYSSADLAGHLPDTSQPPMQERRSSSDTLCASADTKSHLSAIVDRGSATLEPGLHNASGHVADMIELERPEQHQPTEPVPKNILSSVARYTDPFSDEHDMFHSSLAPPLVSIPPVRKQQRHIASQNIPGTYPEVSSDSPSQPSNDQTGFEEQLARALSISLAESDERVERAKEEQINDPALAAAIAASLKDHASKAQETRSLIDAVDQPVVTHDSDSSRQPIPQSGEDDLYTLTPQATGLGRRAIIDTDNGSLNNGSVIDEFASFSDANWGSASHSTTAREPSVDGLTDMEVRSVSSDEEQNGIMTPESWSEIGSHGGDSE